MKNDLTSGIIWKQVLWFFIPVVIGAFFQHLYTIVDTIIVGKGLGTIELAAVGGSASKLIVMITNFFIGVSSGITAYASISYGEKNYYKLKSIIYNGLVLFVPLGIIISILGFLFSNDFLVRMKTPTDTINLAYLAGILFCVIYNTFAGVLRAMGDTKRPLYVLLFCSIVNIILDILLALVFQMGVFGVALATVISQALSALILAVILIKTLKSTGDYKCTINLQEIKQISIIGIPAGIQSMMFSLSNMAVQSAVNSFSTVSVAAWTAYVKLDSIVDVVVSSLSNTVIPFVGQNIGAKNYRRAKQSVNQIILISYAIIATVTVIFMLNRVFLLSLFTNDFEVVKIASKLIFIIMPMYLLMIPQQMFSQALRARGKSFFPMVLTLVGVVGLRVFWVYFVLPQKPSLILLATCYPISAFAMSVIFTIYYKNEINKQESVS